MKESQGMAERNGKATPENSEKKRREKEIK